MSKYSSSPVYEIVRYAWNQMKESGVVNASDYYAETFGVDLVPFIPVQEQPEVNLPLGELPFIVYDYYASPRNTTDFWIKAGQVIFNIYCPDFNKLVEIATLFEDEFGRHDESARDINNFMTDNIYNFKHVYVLSVAIDREAMDDNGRMTAEVVIDFEYVRELVNGKFA